jgi:putative tryptophan/tyrosine transport system substrate-binding protein
MRVVGVRRREFVILLGGAAAAWPLAARAQQTGKVARIGFLGAASASGYARQVEGFLLGLRELGYIEGTNIVITYRWAEGNYAQLPELAAELTRSNVDVIVTHGTPGALAAKQATATVPIVIAIIGDPVAAGVAGSMARPGANITGLSYFFPEISAKRVELLKEMLPRITRVAVLLNRDNPLNQSLFPKMETAARLLGVGLSKFQVHSPSEFESAFEKMQQEDVKAVVILDDGMLQANVTAIAALATKRNLPSIGNKELTQAGGLSGYGVDFFATFRRAAALVDKILKGTKPADIPIEQATTFQFVLNLKTARSLGVTIPPTLLARADEVIE